MENKMQTNTQPEKSLTEKLRIASLAVFGILGLAYIILEVARGNSAHPEQIYLLEKSLDLPVIFSGLVYVFCLVRLRFNKINSPYFDQVLISIGLILLLIFGYLSVFVEDLAK